MKRQRLPDRYETTRQHVKIAGRSLYIEVGQDHDGCVRSLFLDAAKTGSDARAWSEVLCRAISLGLQYGVPLTKYIRLLRGTKFSPAGAVSGDSAVHFVSSPLDYTARYLEMRYAGEGESHAHTS